MLGGKKGMFAEHSGGAGVGLNLTALMDILSNLLFFLLASYTAQDLEVKKPNLQLPASTSDVKVVPSLVVTITKDEVLVADVPVGEVKGTELVGPVDEEERVVALYQRLKNARSARAAAGFEGVAADTMLLLADQSLDAMVVTRVLKTAGSAGFVNVRFGVLAR